jgi:hypothetical protein
VKPNRLLVIASVISVLLFMSHMTSDIMLGIESGDRQDLVGATLISLVWLSGALLLSAGPAGYIIMLLGAVLAVGVPYLHMGGAGVGGEFVKKSGAFFFIWTLLAMGLSGAFSLVLSLRGLLKREWKPAAARPFP